MIGKWGIKKDGTPSPNLKALVKPLIGMMHGERGTKKWKQELDRILKDCHTRPELSVSQVVEVGTVSVPHISPHFFMLALHQREEKVQADIV